MAQHLLLQYHSLSMVETIDRKNPDIGFEKMAYLENKHPILFASTSITGSPVFYDVIFKVIQDTNVDKIVICGAPSRGKTSLVEALTESIEVFCDEPIHWNFVFFDLYRKRMIDKIGSTANWTPENWAENSRLMTHDINNPPVVPGKRVITIFETVGPVGTKDRGTTTISEIKDNSLTIIIEADPRIALYGNQLREFVLKAPAKGLKSALERRGVFIGDQFADDESSGLQIKQIYQNMAQRFHVEMIEKEEDSLIDPWIKDPHHFYERLALLDGIVLPEGVEDTLPKQLLFPYKRRIAYAEHLLRNVLGRDKMSGIVLINHYLENAKKTYARVFAQLLAQ